MMVAMVMAIVSCMTTATLTTIPTPPTPSLLVRLEYVVSIDYWSIVISRKCKALLMKNNLGE